MAEATLELQQSLDTNPQQLLEKMGDYIKPVSTEPAKVSRDIESDSFVFNSPLPISGGDIYSPDASKFFGRLIAKEGKNDGAKFLTFNTKSSGRATYFTPVLFSLEKGNKNVVVSTIMEKGSGSVKSLNETRNPFSESEGDARKIEGMASIKDIRLDAEYSKRLFDAGVRTRVALAVFLLDEIPYEGKYYKPQEFMKLLLGKNSDSDNLPGIGLFASRSAFRIRDMWELLMEEDLDSPIMEAFLLYHINLAQFDDSPELKDFGKKYKDCLKTRQIRLDKKSEILGDFTLVLSRILGHQAANFEKAGAVKVNTDGDPHEILHNISTLGESMDNSQMVFGATTEMIAGYQNALRSVLLEVPNSATYYAKDEKIKKNFTDEMWNRIRRNFAEGYLDETMPGWEEGVIPDEFVLKTTATLGITSDDVQVAYTIAKIKSQMLAQEGKSDSTHDEYNLSRLTSVFSLFPFSSTNKHKQFIHEYINMIEAPYGNTL